MSCERYRWFYVGFKKGFDSGRSWLLYALKFDANVCNIYNFEQNEIHFFIVYLKRGLRFFWYRVFGQWDLMHCKTMSH